jgi:hypothetical protein
MVNRPFAWTREKGMQHLQLLSGDANTPGFEVPPKLPRSWTEPSASQSTACGPAVPEGITVLPHLPEMPTA